MAKLAFQNQALEKLFSAWKWSRNNSIWMFTIAAESNILDYAPDSNEFSFEPIRHQFQCLVTTTDTYCRRLTDAPNLSFGVLVQDERVVAKHGIADAR